MKKIIICCAVFILAFLSVALTVNANAVQKVEVNNGIITVSGKLPAGSDNQIITIFLLYPNKSINDIQYHSDTNKVIAHVGTQSVNYDGSYQYDFNFTGASDQYTLYVKFEEQSFELALNPALSSVITTNVVTKVEVDSENNEITVDGKLPEGTDNKIVTIFLLYPNKDLSDLQYHSDTNEVIAHVGTQLANTDGSYRYKLNFIGPPDEYLLYVIYDNQTFGVRINPAVSTVIGGEGEPLVIDFGLQTDYDAIEGTTVEQRFNERVDELPDEIPVISPFEVKGAVSIFVSPNGDDNNVGSIFAPLKTITKAIEMVSSLSEFDKEGGVVIYLREGSYSANETITLNSLCSGVDSAPLFISSYNNEKVSIVGGEPIPTDSLENVSDSNILNRLCPSAQNNILVADLAALGISNYGSITKDEGSSSLFVDGMKMTLARWPNASEAVMGEVIDRGPITAVASILGPQEVDDGRGFEFEINNTRPFSWENTGDIWMYGSFYAEWEKGYYQIRNFNNLTNSIRTVNNEPYGAQYKDDNTYYYLNVLEELDTPGEWYLDRDNGKLYIYPVGEINNAVINLTTSNNDIMQLCDTNNVVINGITFEKSLSNGITVQSGYKNIIQNCLIQKISGNGVLINGGYKNGVISSVIRETEDIYGAVRLNIDTNARSGLIPQRNFVQNCNIYDALNGIFVMDIGSVVSHNLIQHTKNNGIYLSHANESIIEYNEITGGPYVYKDAGGIYVAGYAESRGNHIRYNYVHDLNGNGDARGIYFDDMSSNNYAYGNVIDRVKIGLYNHNGKDDVFFNNIVINAPLRSICDSINFYDPYIFQQIWTNMATNKTGFISYMKEDNWAYLDITNATWTARYPEFVDFDTKMRQHIAERQVEGYVRNSLEDYLRSPTNNYYGNNLVVNSHPLQITSIGLETATGLSTNFETDSDPGFIDFANKNYKLNSNSAVYNEISGFTAPPFEKMGLLTQSSYWNNILSDDDIYCITPLNNSIDNIGSEDVNFKWTPVYGADYYTLTIATDIDFNNIIGEYKTDYTYYTITLNGAQETYYWKIQPHSYSKTFTDSFGVAPAIWSFATQNIVISSVAFTDEAGNGIDNISSATEINCKLTLQNTSEINKTVSFIMRGSRNNTLINADYLYDINIPAGSISDNIELHLNNLESKINCIKFYFWSNLNQIMSLRNCVIYNFN